MYCSKCGNQIPDGTKVCQSCAQTPKGKLFTAPGKASKSYAAVFSALLVFPALICVAIDVAVDRYDYWFGYVLGALLVTWVIAVFPVLGITPPAITALVTLSTITGYIYYILSKSGKMDNLPEFILPMFALTAFFISLDTALIGKKVKGLHAVSLLALEAVIYLISWEVILDKVKTGAIELGWSLIISCIFISIIAVAEAFAYVRRLNKKQ